MISGKTVAKLRKEKGYTQKELADILNISDRTLSKIEKNVYKVNYQLEEKINDVFQIKSYKISPVLVAIFVCMLSLLAFSISLINVSNLFYSKEFLERLMITPNIIYSIIYSVLIIYVELIVTGFAYYILYRISQYGVLFVSSLIVTILSLSDYLGVILAGSIDCSIVFSTISLIALVVSIYKMKNELNNK